MLLRLLFSSVVMISRARDFPMLLLLLHVKMENLFLLLPCLAQKDFRSFFYCAVLHKSSSNAGCEERQTFFFKCGSDSGVLFWCVSSLTGCGCCSSIWWSDEGDLGSCRFSSRFTSSFAGIFATHFLPIATELSSKLNLENGKVCMYVQRCDWFDLHTLSRAQSWRLVTAIHRKVMVHVEHFVSKHSHKVATATLIVMLPSIFVVVEDWSLCKFHRYLILIEGTVLNVMMFNRRLS